MSMLSWPFRFLKRTVLESVCIARESHVPMLDDESRFLDGIHATRENAGIAGDTVSHADAKMYTTCERCGVTLEMTYSVDEPESYWVTES